ncbi:hypothetical protein D3C86_1415600 [compost metagenome]
MNLSGTVSIKNKAGLVKTENWSHTIKIMRPQGTVSLPKLNVLYKGYDNLVEGVASGYDQTFLSGAGVSLSKSGTQHIARVTTSAKTASIDIYGINSVSKKKVKLGSYSFRVMTLPDPEFYFGAAEEGGKISSQEKRLFARYKNSPLDAVFVIKNWEVSTNNAPRPERGVGNVISDDASRLLRQGRPGTIVNVKMDYIGPDGILRKKIAAFVL